MHWVNKYTPNKLDDFIGNNSEINKGIQWINDYKNTYVKTPILFITGNSGTGKTVLSNLLFDKYGFHPTIFTSYDLKNKKTIESDILKLLASNNINNFFFDIKLEKGIILDNIDYISSSDKVTINKLNNLIKKKYTKGKGYKLSKPIVFISNGRNDRKLTDIKKISMVITLNKLNTIQYLKYINRITQNENITIEDEVSILLYQFSGYDLRLSIIYLQELSKIYDNNINIEQFLHFQQNVTKKKTEQNLFNSIHNILVKFENVSSTMNVYDGDRCLVPMMIHQNYIKYINVKQTDNYTKLKVGATVLNNIIDTDIIDHYIHNYQLWYLQKFNGINYCCKTSYLLNQLKSLDTTPYNIEFTHLLSKSALQYFNYQNNLLLKNIFGINKNNILYIIDIILHNILVNKNIDEELQYLESYNITLEILEKMIRLSKICKNYKVLLTTEYKNILKKKFKNINQPI